MGEELPYHINSVEELNTYYNLLVLCPSCHSDYDDNVDYDSYLKMLQLKNKIMKQEITFEFVAKQMSTFLDLFKDLTKSIVDELQEFEDADERNLTISKLREKLEYNQVNRIHSNKVLDSYKN